MVATRERALSEREFELLLEGAGRITDTQRRLETRAAILLGGRLGLRPGETTHLSASWIDLDRQMIQIPTQEDCTKGRDGGICGYCRQAVKQRVDHDPDERFQHLADRYWIPKTDAAARTVPYHFSYRVRIAVELLLDRHGGWPYSFSTLQRRLETALERSPELSEDATSLHGLRATAASYHAGRGLHLVGRRAIRLATHQDSERCSVGGRWITEVVEVVFHQIEPGEVEVARRNANLLTVWDEVTVDIFECAGGVVDGRIETALN